MPAGSSHFDDPQQLQNPADDYMVEGLIQVPSRA
jgi:hypothetical protein